MVLTWASLVAQQERAQLPMQETQEMLLPSLGWEGPLEQGVGSYSRMWV